MHNVTSFISECTHHIFAKRTLLSSCLQAPCLFLTFLQFLACCRHKCQQRFFTNFDRSANSIHFSIFDTLIFLHFTVTSFVFRDSLPSSFLCSNPPTATAGSITVVVRLSFSVFTLFSFTNWHRELVPKRYSELQSSVSDWKVQFPSFSKVHPSGVASFCSLLSCSLAHGTSTFYAITWIVMHVKLSI